ALSITEQCISYDDNILSYENVCKTLCYLPKENINKLVELISNSKLNDIVNLIEEFYLQSIDFENLLKELISIFHNSLVSKKTGLRYEGDNEFSINKIASSFENEAIQEMYRSGIDSLKDFPYAPNHKCAFEMAILNILLVCEPKSSEIKKKNKEIGETKPDTNETTSTITGSRSISWEDTITKLKLDQITLNLANNLELSNHDNNRITFLISESLSGLVTERCKLKLKEALCLYYKDKIEIDINFTDNNLDTVQDKVNEKKQKELESAKKTLVEDDFVKILQDKYNAEIISGSVKTNEE
ncbi:MAG: DNA polymerase III subunit gamma/tau C-terminal domain-containing protein, partial [Pseudomonadota bacterium]|nr:DNA polymerase III subunit gamma/tau C-terminal domain-containing protein [Pseudomonadota bacterium]